MANVPAKVVAERLGHSSVTQTLDTYSHVLPVLEEKATDELRNVLFQNPNKPAPQIFACLPPGNEAPPDRQGQQAKKVKLPRRPRKRPTNGTTNEPQ